MVPSWLIHDSGMLSGGCAQHATLFELIPLRAIIIWAPVHASAVIIIKRITALILRLCTHQMHSSLYRIRLLHSSLYCLPLKSSELLRW